MPAPHLRHYLAYDIMISFFATTRIAPMAQIVVRNLDESLKARLKKRAKRYGRSMEEEVREILRNAVRESARPSAGLGSRIALRFAAGGLRSDLPELREQAPRPAEFKS
jgi:antitoxin FitA